MQLPSGKIIADGTLRDIANGWALEGMAPGVEHAADVLPYEGIINGDYDGIKYDGDDFEFIIGVLVPVVINMIIELKEAYGKIYKKHLATRIF